MAESKSKSADDARNQRTTGIIVAVGLLLLVFGFSALLSAIDLSRANPVWFIGMLIVFGSSLALIAVVFRWLDLAAPAEAFGLPAGSIRTLLAIGVMVLFAVFGLQTVTTDTSDQRLTADESLGNAVFTGDAKELKKEVERYRKINIAAVVESRSADGATLKLYRLEHFKPTATVDMEKQIITALVTLVTSVVSFYFGSRTAEATRDSASGTKLPPATEDELKRIDTQLTDLRKRITDLHADQATPGNEAALASSLSQADSDLKTVEDARAALDTLVKALGSGGSTPEAASTAVTRLSTLLAALGQLVAQAEALVAKG